MWQYLTSKKIHITRTTCRCGPTLCSHHKYVAVSHLQKITHCQNDMSMWTDTVLSPQICGSLLSPRKITHCQNYMSMWTDTVHSPQICGSLPPPKKYTLPELHVNVDQHCALTTNMWQSLTFPKITHYQNYMSMWTDTVLSPQICGSLLPQICGSLSPSQKLHITRTTCQCGPTLCSHHKYVAVSHLPKNYTLPELHVNVGRHCALTTNMWQSLTSKKYTLPELHVNVDQHCALTTNMWQSLTFKKITHCQNYMSMCTDTVLSPQICGSLPPPKTLHIARTTCQCGPTLCSHHKYVAVSHLQKNYTLPELHINVD